MVPDPAVPGVGMQAGMELADAKCPWSAGKNLLKTLRGLGEPLPNWRLLGEAAELQESSTKG